MPIGCKPLFEDALRLGGEAVPAPLPIRVTWSSNARLRLPYRRQRALLAVLFLAKCVGRGR